jgi:uncharacterized membrane protein YccC
MQKSIAYFIMALVGLFTVVAILAIWEVIDIQNILSKSMKSLFVLFLSAIAILGIDRVLLRKEETPAETNS